LKKNRILSVAATFVACYLFYLLLAWSLGWQELLFGALVSLLVALFSARFFIHEKPLQLFNPLRFLALVFYSFVVFMIELVEANVDVARRALNGKVNPGIVKIPVEVESEYGQAMLANSITLTPGTITMDVAEEEGQTYYYIHWIDVTATGKDAGIAIKGTLEKWVRRIFN